MKFNARHDWDEQNFWRFISDFANLDTADAFPSLADYDDTFCMIMSAVEQCICYMKKSHWDVLVAGQLATRVREAMGRKHCSMAFRVMDALLNHKSSRKHAASVVVDPD
eukprot:710335_1